MIEVGVEVMGDGRGFSLQTCEWFSSERKMLDLSHSKINLKSSNQAYLSCTAMAFLPDFWAAKEISLLSQNKSRIQSPFSVKVWTIWFSRSSTDSVRKLVVAPGRTMAGTSTTWVAGSCSQPEKEKKIVCITGFFLDTWLGTHASTMLQNFRDVHWDRVEFCQ